MSRSLALSFQSASAKYSRLHKKIKKSIAKGEFFRFTSRKRNHLLARIEKLRKRLTELKMQLRLASAGLAAAAIFGATSADAQVAAQFGTKVGPFIQNEIKNPLPAPPFIASQTGLSVQYTEVQYHDFDKDGDLDAILTFGYRTRVYYENIGTKTQAKWEERMIGDIFQASLPGPNYADNFAHQTYADLDDDGDLDAIGAVNMTQTNPSPDNIFFMENQPQESGDPYFLEPTSAPFSTIIANNAGWPVLADVDGDGDSDLILAGRYFDIADDKNAFIQYFRNDKVGHAPGVMPTFTAVTGSANNPFFLQDTGFNYVAVNFADLDGDNDQDFIYTTGDASTRNTYYKRNEGGGTFTNQIGNWNGDTGTGNPFDDILNNIATTNGYLSLTFGDLDGDGDDDATVGLANPLNTSLSALYPFRYLENTGKGVFDFSEENQIEGHSFGDNLTSTMFDHDGDGDLDIVTVATTFRGVSCEGSFCGQQYYVSQKVFLNEGGVFSSDPIEVEMPEGFPTNGSNYVQLIDVEGDGDLDIFSNFDFDGSQALIYWRNDEGTYNLLEGEDNPFDFANAEGFPFSKPALADLDNDGLKDLILTPSYPGSKAYKNVGTKANPVFELQDDWTNGALSDNASYDSNSPSLVDMDGDGDYDFIVSKYFGEIYYFKNEGTKEEPLFTYYGMGQTDKDGQPQNIEYWGENPFAFFTERMGNFNIADIDNDGDNDLLFGEYQHGIFKLYENQNPAPDVVVGSSKTLGFVPNEPLTLITQVSIEDPDEDLFVKIVAQVTPFKAGTDLLQLVGNFGNAVEASWADTTGILTITGIEEAEVTDILKGIQYTFIGDESASGRTSKKQDKNATAEAITRTIEVVTYDSDLTKETSNTNIFNVSGGDNKAPIITNPRKTAASGGNIAFYISQIAQDLDGEIDLASAVVTSQKGDVQIGSDGDLVTIDYSGDKTFQGKDEVYVSVCDNLGACSNSTFNVEIKSEIFVYTGMSPNNDLINDWFQIDFIPEGTHVAIYNRWGDLIYDETNYNVDDPARRFEGKNKNGTEVIAGTYYYKIKYPGGSAKTGYILLNR